MNNGYTHVTNFYLMIFNHEDILSNAAFIGKPIQ